MSTYRIIETLRKKGLSVEQFVFTSASSIYQSYWPSTLLDWNDYYYHSKREIGAYIRFDFTVPTYIEKVVIRSAIQRDPRFWVIEGSVDTADFVGLYQNDDKKLCENWGVIGDIIGCTENKDNVFDINQTGYYKSIKIRQTGPSSNSNEYIFILSAVDFIGHITIDTKSCKVGKNYVLSHYISFFILLTI